MISLSASHLSEVSAIPDLLALVDNTNVRLADNFTQLCAIHNCFESFMHVLPHSSFSQNPLTLLARLDQWNIVQQMDCTRFSLNDWKKAFRRAGKSGHIQFIDNALSVCEDQDACVRAAVLGASMHDQRAIVQRFLPSISDQAFIGHIAVTAAQHGSINCARYCVEQVTPKQWLSMLSSTVNTHQSHIFVTDMLLDYAPQNYPTTPEWCVKFAKRLAHTSVNDTVRAWSFVLQHMSWDDVQNIVVRWPSDQKNTLKNIHQNVVINQAINNQTNPTPFKRKM